MSKKVSLGGGKNKNLLLGIAIIVLLAIVGYLAYQIFISLNVRSEKAAFQKIEKDIDSLIVGMEEANPTVITQKEKYCSNDGEKYGNGQLRCAMGINFKISNDKADKATDDFVKSLSTRNFANIEDLKILQNFSRGRYSHISTKSDCFASIKKIDSTKVAEINFYCTRKAYRAIFPML